MSNPIKYSTGSETLALKKGNFYIGTGDVGKGPTSSTGYYNGITPPSGGYTIYLNKENGGPSIYTVTNDTQLISLTNSIAGQSYTTANECLVYFAGQTDKMVLNRNYEGIVTDGLVCNLDAGFTPSYPKNGTTWYDISSNGNNGTLTNGATFNSNSGGGILFDGIDDYVSVDVDSFIRNNTAYTLSSFFYYTGGSNGGAPFNVLTSPNISNTGDGFWQHLNFLNGWLWRTEDDVSGEYGDSVVSPSIFSNNNYYHITVVVKTNSLLFYVNGILISTVSTNFQWSRLRTDHEAYLYVGAGYGAPGSYAMSGIVNIFNMYTRELSADEILQNFNAQKGRFGL
jgi:hypothetical protein